MPLYHFNVPDDADMPDSEGTDLPDIRTAQREAVRLAGRLLLDHPDDAWDGSNRSDWHMEVSNGIGRVLFRLDFIGTVASTAHA